MNQNPMVVVDTAHNADGYRELQKQLETLIYRKLFIVFGTVKDKDLSIIIPALPKQAFYVFIQAAMPRSMDVKEIYKAAQLHSLKGITCANVKLGFTCAFEMAGKNDLILITGSNFVVAEALQEIKFKKQN